MSGFDRERVRNILTNPSEGDWTVNAFEPWDEDGQKWYTSKEEILQTVEETGSAIIGSTSCDMCDLLDECEERGWRMKAEAGGVYKIMS